MKLIISAGWATVILGVILLLYAQSFPVYTDPDAPGRLSQELGSLPREQRFQQWYHQLSLYETPHKQLSDTGSGVLAFGLGVIVATLFLKLYIRSEKLRKKWVLFLIWITLWGLQLPFTVWYYSVRQNRFDYPVWGDSIAIPIFQDSFGWIVLGTLSTIILFLMTIKRSLPLTLRFNVQKSILEWLRTAFLSVWVMITIFGIYESITHGDAGTAFVSPFFTVILLVALASKKSNQGMDPTLTDAN